MTQEQYNDALATIRALLTAPDISARAKLREIGAIVIEIQRREWKDAHQ